MRVTSVVCVVMWVVCMFPMISVAEQTPSVSAASAVLYEPQSGVVLFAKDAFTHRSMASTTKLMTALLAAESGDLARTVTVSEAATRVEGTSMGLRGGDVVTLHDLTAGALLASGNDAANAIAVAVSGSVPAFVERMNARAVQLGMKDTVFATPSGLDEKDHGAGAYDMALLAAEVLKNESLATICASKTMRVTVSGRTYTLYNHNKLLSMYDGCIGMKTGFTKKAGRCLVSAAKRDGVTLIAVTLNAPNDWNDHIALFDYGFSLVKTVTPDVDLPSSLPIAGGVEDTVGVTAEIPNFTVPTWDEVSVKAEIARPIWAPVCTGEQIGRLCFYNSEGALLGTSPVTVRNSVEVRPHLPRYIWFYRYFRQLICQLLQ